MRVGIVGSGISGLSIGQMLSKKHSTVLFEAEKKNGGLIKCERVNNCLFHKVGGHVFNSKNQDVLSWFWQFFIKDDEFVQAKRNAKILINNSEYGYPIEYNIYNLDKNLIKKIIDELIDLQNININNCQNFEEFLLMNFGETLFKLYFKPYNEKIWKTDLRSIPIEWLEGKLPFSNFKEIVYYNFLRIEEGDMVHSTFYYPKYNGSQFIVDRLSKGLNIIKNYKLDVLKFESNKIIFNNTEVFDKMVFTGDIRKMPDEIYSILSENGVNINYLKSLKSNGTSNLFCETDKTSTSWLYLPDKFTKAHRIIYTGNFSETNNIGSERNTCVVEFSGEIPFSEMVEEAKKLPGNLNPLDYNFERNSYIIHDQYTRNEINKTKIVLEKYGVYLLGRFAEWEYYNMDKAIEAAMILSEKIK